jgi:hypothetical protein
MVTRKGHIGRKEGYWDMHDEWANLRDFQEFGEILGK